MFALINPMDKDCLRFEHFKYILDLISEHENSKYLSMSKLIENKKHIKEYLIGEFGVLPKYYITFLGIGGLNEIIDEIKPLFKIIIISDDIHHSSRIANPRKRVFENTFINLNTYGYQLNRWNIPNMENNYFFPHSARWIIEMNVAPIPKVLISGSQTNIYPDRTYVASLKNVNMELLDKKIGIIKESFYKYLSKYLCCFVDTARDYVLAKTFEICGAGSLLLCMNNDILDVFNMMGFIDGINYIACTRENIEEKIDYIINPNNRSNIDAIRKAGQELIRTRHNSVYRFETLLNILSGDFNAKQEINSKYNTKFYLGF